jgi:hypothetical protein
VKDEMQRILAKNQDDHFLLPFKKAMVVKLSCIRLDHVTLTFH